MQALCMPGEDPHSFMGARIAGDEYRELIRRVHDGDKTAKEHRQLGKVGNLSLQFRTSARKLRKVARVDYGIDLHLDTAQRVRTTYLNTYTHVPVYWAQQIQKTKRLGYVETLAGRRVQVEGNWDGEFGWSMGSTAINYRIQGTGADQKYLALAVLRPVLREFAMHFAWDLHDGIYFYVPRTQLLRAVPRIRALLNALPYKQAWGLQPPIPLTWDCKVGRTWGSLQEIDDGDEDGLRAYTNGPGV
jgi:DNA polymerase-1